MSLEKITEGAAVAMAINPGEPVVLESGVTVLVFKAAVKDIKTVGRLIVQVYNDVADEKGQIQMDKLQGAGLISVLEKHTEAVFDVVHQLTDVPRQDLDMLLLDDAVRLVAKVWEVNHDFFSKRVLQEVKSAGVPLFGA